MMGAGKTFLLIGGFADSLLNFRGALLEELKARGLEVHAASPDLHEGHPVAAQLRARGIHTHSVPMRRAGVNPLADIATLFHMLSLNWRLRPDYFMGYAIKPVIYGTLAAWGARVPNRYALVTGLGYTFQDEPDSSVAAKAVRIIARRLYAWALGKSHKVFFQNPDDERLFRMLGLIGARGRTCVVDGSGVDTARFSVAPLPDAPRFLLIARLLVTKGVREYVQAAGIVRKTVPYARFALAGWIDENPASIGKAELDEWCKTGAVDYLGHLSDVRPALAACSVYVLPSYREGTPRTVLEAMSMGRPIITTDAPGCRETVRDGVNGFLVPVQSVDGLVEAMLRFVRNPELVSHMGGESRRMAEDRYEVHKVNSVMMSEMGLGE